MIEKAQEEETKEYAYRMWLVQYQNMTKKNFKSFNQFYDEIKPKKVTLDNRSKEAIMEDILKIENKFRKEE